jgi:hypothetical protein
LLATTATVVAAAAAIAALFLLYEKSNSAYNTAQGNLARELKGRAGRIKTLQAQNNVLAQNIGMTREALEAEVERSRFDRQAMATLKERTHLTDKEIDEILGRIKHVRELKQAIEDQAKSENVASIELAETYDATKDVLDGVRNAYALLGIESAKYDAMMIQSKQRADMFKASMMSLAESMSGAMIPAFQQLIYNGKFAMDSMKTFFEGILEGFRNMLAQMLAELLAKAVIFTLLRAFTGGGSFIAEGATDLVSSMLRGMGFANGVRNFGGGLAMVGELGPELVSMPPGSNVYNNNDTEHILNNAGAMNITVNVDGGMGSVAEARRIGKVAADEIHRRVKLARRV